MDADTTVRALLAAAGIDPAPDEVAALVAAYPVLRAGADNLWFPEAVLEEPAVAFRLDRTR